MHGIGARILHVEHLGNRRAEDIGIQQSHAVAQPGQRNGKVHRDRALAYSPFSAAHGNDILYARQHFACFRPRFRLELRHNLHLHVFSHMVVDGSLGRLHRRIHERVGVAREFQHHFHLHPVNGRLVGNHPAFHKIFLRARILHRSQGIHNHFWIERHLYFYCILVSDCKVT